MSKRRLATVYGLVLFVLVLVSVIPAQAAYVTPKIGGAQRTHEVAPMIMPLITFDGDSVSVLKEDGSGPWETLTGNDRPAMWPLEDGNEFDSAKTWYNALNGKAYNFQYGWSNAAFDQGSLPSDCNIWIEVLSQSDGLNTYDRTLNSYNPIFGTNGLSNKWKWNDDMSMAHNAYAVTPAYAQWYATYWIYVGDSATGMPLPNYGSDIVTFTWTSVPEPATMGLLGMGSIYLLHKRRKD